ncbi:MAG: hypothetical protein RLZZ200_1060 [Pseudomonadota bacterium]|jgi:hypothetical protein
MKAPLCRLAMLVIPFTLLAATAAAVAGGDAQGLYHGA